MKESNKQFDDVKASLHTEALKLADELDALSQYVPSEAPAMIRKLVASLYTQTPQGVRVSQYLTDDEILMMWVRKNNLMGARDILNFAREIISKSSNTSEAQDEDQRIDSALQRLSDLTMYAEEVAKFIELKSVVKDFFDNYLDYQETTDSGSDYRPIYLSCGRCMMMQPLSDLLIKMRELSEARSKK